MKLIDKDELEEFLNELTENLGDSDFNRGFLCAIDSIFGCYLNTLEVKEVDLEKTINDYFRGWKFDKELDIMVKPNNYSASFTDLKEIARHFFELGLNAQKGE